MEVYLLDFLKAETNVAAMKGRKRIVTTDLTGRKDGHRMPKTLRREAKSTRAIRVA